MLNWQRTLMIGIGLLFLFQASLAQDNMGIGTASPNPKSILELSASDKGFLMPRVSTSQRLAINPAPGADEGLMVYDETDSLFYYWNATQWVPLNNQGGSGPDGDWIISGNDMYNNVSGNTGIGTASPSAKLHTNGSLRFDGLSFNSDNDVLVIDGNGDVSYRTLSSGVWDGDDNDYVDGINITGGTTKTITLPRTGSLGSLNASLSIEDADADSTNELNTDLQLNGTTLELTDAGGTLTQDLTGIGSDDQNIQGSVLSANKVLTIGIENGANETVDLSSLDQPNTDNQDLGSSTISGTVKEISITNGNSTTIDVADNDDDPTNEYNTNLNLNGTTLAITDNGATLTEDLSALQSGSQDADADSTNELQDLSSSKSSNNVTVDITDGNSTNFNVDDADANPSNELQNLTVTQNNDTVTWKLDNGGGSGSFTTGAGGDNDWTIGTGIVYNTTDNVGIGTLAPNAKLHTDGSLRFQGLSSTTEQDVLVINGTGDVSYRTLGSDIWDGDDVADGDTDPTNEYNTGISLSGNTLNITDNGSTLSQDLSSIDTDNQDIQGSAFSTSTNELTIGIQNGSNEIVDLSALDQAGSDDQNIQGSGLSGTNLTIDIENGTAETIDLAPINTDNQNLFRDIQNAAGATQFSAGNASDNLQFSGQNGASVSFDAANNRIIIDAGGAGDDWGSQTVNSDGTLNGDGAGTQLSVDWSAANDLDNNGNVNLATLSGGNGISGSNYNGSFSTTWSVDWSDANDLDNNGNINLDNLSGGDGINGSNYNGSSATTWSVDWSDANDLDASGNVDQLWNEQTNDDISYGGGSEGDVRIGTNSFTNYQLQVDGEFVITEKSSHTLPNSSSAVWMLKRPTGAEIKTIDDNDNLDTLRLKASNVSIGDPYPSEARLSVEDDTSTAGYFAGQDVENNSGNWTSAVQIEDPEGDKLYMDGDEIDAGIGGDASDDALYLQNNNSNDVVMVDGGGNVGIGANPPNYQLDVAGDINVTGGIRASGNNGTSGQVLKTDGTNVYWGSDNTGSGGDNDWSIGSGVVYNTSDNVGIGTGSPSESLEVDGNIYASGGDLITSSTNGVINAGGGKMNSNMNVISDGTVDNQLASGDEDLYINGELEVDGSFRIENAIEDNNGNTGSSGDVLASTGSGVEWQKRGVLNEKVYQASTGPVWQHPNFNVQVNWDPVEKSGGIVNEDATITVENNTSSNIMISIKEIEEGGSAEVNVTGKTNWEKPDSTLSMNATVDCSYKIMVTDFQSSSPGFKMDVHGRDGNWVGGIVKYWN